MKKLKVGILGATGMVGQQFIHLLSNHPWFDITVLAASDRSKGKRYIDAVSDRWKIEHPMPEKVKYMDVLSVSDIREIARKADFVFSALEMEKDEIKKLEENYASHNIPVVSNNSAHRWTPDVPMIMPEVNANHAEIILSQRKNRGWQRGLIAVKPNCSIQSYVTILSALWKYIPYKVHVTSLQSISGAGKTFATWPEMTDNVIPYIGGEEEKSEKEPLKIWGNISINNIISAKKPIIDATCIRVPTNNGHLASVSVKFKKIPSEEEILSCVKKYNPLSELDLPSSPGELIKYFKEDNRPQTRLDRNFENGMGISMGRLRKDRVYHWKFISLSHNTVRGAAGGAILLAELLVKKGYI